MPTDSCGRRLHVFLATGLTATDKDPDAEEHDLAARSVPVAEFEQMMLDGTIRDGCTHLRMGTVSDVEGQTSQLSTVSRIGA